MDERKVKREAKRIIECGITDSGKARLIMNSLSFMINDEEAEELARQLEVQWQKWCKLRPDFWGRREKLWNELAERHGFEEASRILDEKIGRGEI